MKLAWKSLLLLVLISCSKAVPLENKDFYTRNYPNITETEAGMLNVKQPTASAVDSSSPETPVAVDTDKTDTTQTEDTQKVAEDNDLAPVVEDSNIADAPVVEDNNVVDARVEQSAPTSNSVSTDEQPSEETAFEDRATVQQEAQNLVQETIETEQSILPQLSKQGTGELLDLTEKVSFSDDDKTTEQRILSSVIVAFQERDELKFFDLSKEFLVTYPNSKFVNRIKGLREEFYFRQSIDYNVLAGQSVEFNSFNNHSWADWQNSMQQLKQYGVENLVFTPFQNFDQRIVPFENNKSFAGALFNSGSLPVVSDALKTVNQTTKELNIKLTIKLPLKNYDWLDIADSQLMDQSWDRLRGEYNYNFKFNWFHPQALNYIKKIIDQLALYDIEGILISADYLLWFSDGYSQFNQILYNAKTKSNMRTSQIPAAFWDDNFSLSEAQLSRGFRRIHNWRVSSQHLFLLNVVRYIRNIHPRLKIGLELLPELVNNPKESLYKYSISYQQLVSLPVDYFVLNHDPTDLTHQTNYVSAVEKLAGIISIDTPLILRVEYDNSQIGNLVRNITEVRELLNKTNSAQFIFGPNVPGIDWLLLTKN